MIDDSKLAPLLDAAAHGTLVVLAGAGISVDAPSCLPDWLGFNRALLEEIKTAALALPGLNPAAATAIRRLDYKDLSVESFSDAVVGSFAGESYFPVLDVLDAEQPNANHLAIAALAKRGACQAIVTTNFDTLLERACSRAGVDVEVFASADDFRRVGAETRGLYKVHGSVTAAASLVDTVSQKLRGLSFPVRARLRELLAGHHVLVVGFSGTDLAFGTDYLSFSSLKEANGGLTWIVQPGRTLHPQVDAIVRGVGGQTVEASLGEIFERLGVGGGAAASEEPNLLAAARAAAEARSGARIRKWFDGLGGGSFSSALFCIELTTSLGRSNDAEVLRDAIAKDLDRRASEGHVPLTALVAFNVLAIAANDAGEYHRAEHWCSRGAVLWQTAHERVLASPEPVSPAGRRQLDDQWITICLQLGRARAALGDGAGAREAFARSRSAVAQRDAPEVVSSILINETILLARENAPLESRLTKTRQAWSFASKAGSALNMAQAAGIEAFTLTMLGEYDAALAALARGERVARWSGAPLVNLAIATLPAEIALRRGRDAEALEGFERAITGAAGDRVLQARFTLVLLSSMAFSAAFRSRLVGHLDSVASAMSDGRLVSDGSNAHLPSLQDLTAFRADLQQGNVPDAPGFLSAPEGVPESEVALRRMLVKAERNGETGTAARVLLNLADGRYDLAKPRRMLDLAEAALVAAERAGDEEARHAALHLVGNARDLSGDLQGAMDASRRVVDADPPASLEQRVRASQTLALVLARIGRTAEAEPLLRAAVSHHASKGQVAEQARSIFALADVLAGSGQIERAQAVLREHASVITSTGDRSAVAKRDAILALRPSTGTMSGAGLPVLYAESAGGATLEKIDQLRQASESPSDLCEVAQQALCSGHVRPAMALLLDAQARFHTDSDIEGAARCFHLLADAAQVDGRWDAAADHTRFALRLHDELQDDRGRTCSLAALALEFAMVQQLDFAIKAATQCLERDRSDPVSGFTAVAHYALGEAWRLRGRHQDARDQVAHVRAALAAARGLAPDAPLRVWLEDRVRAAD